MLTLTSYEVYIVSIFERNSQLQQNLTAQAKTILKDIYCSSYQCYFNPISIKPNVT